MRTGFMVVVRPDVEWAHSPTVGQVFDSRETAAAAVAADPVLTPDEFGNDPHVRLRRVVWDPELDEWVVPRCSCYGAGVCAACIVAEERL